MNPVEQFIANYEAFEYSHVSTDTVKFKTDLDAALVYVQKKNVLVRPKEEETLRDKFAAKALPIAYKFWMFDFYKLKLGDEKKFNGGFYKNLKLISETAYEMADEMMEARGK